MEKKKKSLFGLIATVFDDADEESPADIDRDVEAAVAAIASQTVTSLSGDTVLHSGIGKAGDTVFVMDLGPVFAMIGGASGRAADGVRECCNRIFTEHREAPLDRGIVKTSKFIMHFSTIGEEEGFHRAAIIVNEIGVQVLSDRFRTMEVPEILIAADIGDITDENGSMDTAKLDAAVASGGRVIGLSEPKEDDPIWVKLRYKKKIQEQHLVAKKTMQDPGKEGPEWIRSADLSPRRNLQPRSGRDRRHSRLPIAGRDRRRGIIDRRGHGY